MPSSPAPSRSDAAPADLSCSSPASVPPSDLAPDTATPPGGASRRHFVGHLAAAVAAGAVPLAGCASNPSRPSAGRAVFTHGVASGDPLADRVILWTRALPPAGAATGSEVTVEWVVARDAALQQVVARGTATTGSASNYTLKVDASGLSAATTYHYQFQVQGVTSPVGRTRTLPVGAVQQVRLAVASCANYPAGYFHVYAEIARRNDIDAVVHLGDYIYEYARGGYASSGAAAMNRLVEPAHEIVTLQDYRQRYAQYRSDPDLQAMHAAHPVIAVWDDHEVCNDTWRDGAQNHDGDEGPYPERRAAAVQAFHEWLPTRMAPDRNPLHIYRSFAFGDLLALHMLETRLIARDQPMALSQFEGFAGFDLAQFDAEVGAPDRQLLGEAQTQWLRQQLTASPATWQVLGQQIPMAPMRMPLPVIMERKTPGHGVRPARYVELQALQRTAPERLSEAEQLALQEPWVPFNLDAWDGFPAARETVLSMARELGKNLVVLAGDSHNAWSSELRDAQGRPVGVEFATPSVSSPGWERALPQERPADLAKAFVTLVEPLRYCETSRRGFVVLHATRQECTAQWVYVSTVTQTQYHTQADATLAVQAARPGVLSRKG